MDIDHQRRIQRRELKDYQQLLMLMNNLDIVDDETRKEFVCITGPVWKRYTEATKGASQRRITVLFLSNELNDFDELLFVGCDYVKQRQHRCSNLWSGHRLRCDVSDERVHHLTIGLSGRLVLQGKNLTHQEEVPCSSRP